MAAPSGGFWTAVVLAAATLKLAAAVSEPTTVPFDVRPGGVVHSFSQDVGPGVRAKPPPGESMPRDCGYWTEPDCPSGGPGNWSEWQGQGYLKKGRGCLSGLHCSRSLPARRLPLAHLVLEKGMPVDKSSGSRGLVITGRTRITY